MDLGDLAAVDQAHRGQPVTGFALDHRKVAPGTVFGAFPGNTVNGEDYIAAAIANGAVAVVARAGARVDGVPHLSADEPRRLFAAMAAKFFAPFPEVAVAVTGTNGKTSTVELTRQLWRLAGHPAASIGTLGVTTAGDQVSTGLTTPDVVTFLANMGGLAREGLTHVAFEASSHGLAQYRTEGLRVVAAAFTNLSRDHLDYHGDMESYFAAKLRLFSEVLDPEAISVVWCDTDATWSSRVVAAAHKRAQAVHTVGPAGDTIKLTGRTPSRLGQTLDLIVAGKNYRVELPLIGAYQAANALVAAGLVIATGGDVAGTLANLARVQPVRGRLERAVIAKPGAPVYVDYAHTPDGLRAAIEALRPHTDGRLRLVFGAGGDRDTGKRPLMGAVAVELADDVIVTDDNPRTEDPAAIRAAIMAGAPGATEIGDRRAAIAAAIRASGPGDVVLIAGKGHEQGQIVGDRVLPFDDVVVARECADEIAHGAAA
nr:UDP-N-acetylmuramoyl-L-alanyl-D-glutamate--2,6-diaminopimelate ligase [Polymorphobacter sp.]